MRPWIFQKVGNRNCWRAFGMRVFCTHLLAAIILFSPGVLSRHPGFCGWQGGMGQLDDFPETLEGLAVVDLSEVVTVVHQNHDYRHLPGGLKHYYQPETGVNVRLGGGRRTIFTLHDVTHVLNADRLQRKRLDWSGFWREVEIFPLFVYIRAFWAGYSLRCFTR